MIFRKDKNEDVIKRKSYYGFARNYPGKLGTSNYVIGESKAVRKREILRRILIIVILAVLFCAVFVVTDICIGISEMPIEANINFMSATDFIKI